MSFWRENWYFDKNYHFEEKRFAKNCLTYFRFPHCWSTLQGFVIFKGSLAVALSAHSIRNFGCDRIGSSFQYSGFILFLLWHFYLIFGWYFTVAPTQYDISIRIFDCDRIGSIIFCKKRKNTMNSLCIKAKFADFILFLSRNICLGRFSENPSTWYFH